jgi:hypothetical protein
MGIGEKIKISGVHLHPLTHEQHRPCFRLPPISAPPPPLPISSVSFFFEFRFYILSFFWIIYNCLFFRHLPLKGTWSSQISMLNCQLFFHLTAPSVGHHKLSILLLLKICVWHVKYTINFPIHLFASKKPLSVFHIMMSILQAWKYNIDFGEIITHLW